MKKFHKKIAITGRCTTDEFLRGVVHEEPRLLYYLGSFTCTFDPHKNQSIIQMNYLNQGVPFEEIFYFEKEIEESVLREAIGQYSKHLIIIMPSSYNLGEYLSDFTHNCIAFYPSCVGIDRREHSFSNLPYIAYTILPRYRVGQVKLKTMEIEIQKKLRELTPILLASSYPSYLKIYLAHNYLATTVKYFDLSESEENCVQRCYVQSAYGALIKKQCVCQGYAEAYKRMMDIAGIPCKVISGRIVREKKPWHAWNFIIDPESGKSFHIDVTWDSREVLASSEFFCVNDLTILHKRNWNRPYYGSSIGESDIRKRAEVYCSIHRRELLQKGVKTTWMKQER